MSDWIPITEDKAKEFVKNYPVKLTHNFFMDSHSWHDFSGGKKYSDSFVLMADINYGSGGLSFRVNKKFYKE